MLLKGTGNLHEARLLDDTACDGKELEGKRIAAAAFFLHDVAPVEKREQEPVHCGFGKSHRVGEFVEIPAVLRGEDLQKVAEFFNGTNGVVLLFSGIFSHRQSLKGCSDRAP